MFSEKMFDFKNREKIKATNKIVEHALTHVAIVRSKFSAL